jgi:hypothetical protein
MSDDPSALAQQIAALEAALQLPLPEDSRAQLSKKLRALQAATIFAGSTVAGDKVIAILGTVNVSDDARINGVAVGINLGQIIYRRDPQEDERRRLVWYLAALSSKLHHLPLRGLNVNAHEGGSGVSLANVYVMLASETSRKLVVRGPAAAISHYFQDNDPKKDFKPEYGSHWALPSQAIREILLSSPELPSTGDAGFILQRATLIAEAVQAHRHLVLLGNPGSGKSTFLHHLGWALAQRALDQVNDQTSLSGWDDQRQYLPIILSLRKLARRLGADGLEPAVVRTALCDEIESYGVRQVDDLLSEALYSGAVLLLLDGLDEVPLDAAPGVTVDRATTLDAVHAFAQLHARAGILITCRTRAFEPDLRKRLSWHQEMLAPFTLGQIRHFVAAWYAELVNQEQLNQAQADQLSSNLIDAITNPLRPQLRVMAENPLLLTMMALMLYHDGSLPRDRPQLYEGILDLLLGQWDKVRDGQGLAEYLDLPGLTGERLRPLLDRLSYAAHSGTIAVDGRGSIERGTVRDALIAFFSHEHPRRAWALAQRCLDYIEQRSGLLVPDGSASYVFAHLTLQEHCAGRYMLLDRDAIALVMRHRTDEHWREPILLGLGVVQQTNPWLIESILRKLIDREEDEHPKPVERWQRDLILAAEIGADRDWMYLRDLRVDVGPLQRDLRRGLVALLQDQEQPLPIAERVRAGFLLGDLGDPRFPTTVEQWRSAIDGARMGNIHGYFCPILLPTNKRARWIARYPITNAQAHEWMRIAHLPPRRREMDSNFNRPNQPATGMTWYLASAFCSWLSQQTNETIRLPSEAEWEAAARGHDGRLYVWGDKRLHDRAATKVDHNLREWPYTIPVGCYPAGASPVGALDMTGNVWEWTSDGWRPDSEAVEVGGNRQPRVLRGGGHRSTKKQMLATARIALEPGVGFDNGFRVVLEIETPDSTD